VERATHLLLVACRRKIVAKSEPDPNFGTDTPSRLALGICAEQSTTWPDEMRFESRALSGGF
jgi:hypothetical protein